MSLQPDWVATTRIVPEIEPMTTYYSRSGEFLASDTVYGDLDEAVHAACCLCHLHPEGATVYSVTAIQPDSEEGYMVATKALRIDGTTWPVPPDGDPIYTVTTPKGHR